MYKMYQRLNYLVQHLSPKMLAHCMDSLVWLSLQCHLSNTKEILFRECLVYSYVQTNSQLQLNIPDKCLLLNKERYFDRFQKDHTCNKQCYYSTSSASKLTVPKCKEITGGNKLASKHIDLVLC